MGVQGPMGVYEEPNDTRHIEYQFHLVFSALKQIGLLIQSFEVQIRLPWGSGVFGVLGKNCPLSHPHKKASAAN